MRSGPAREAISARSRRLPFRRTIITSDAHAACVGAHGGHDGGIIIVGTGSVGWAIRGGRQYRVGGWGLTLSDEGSAAWLGREALSRAQKAEAGLAEGGIPIGSVLVHQGRIIGRGHNRRVQKGSAILHGEMDALENAGRRPASVYTQSVLYTTLSPCAMCTGAILLYRIPRVIVGENKTFMGEEELLRSRGVVVDVVQDPQCVALMTEFIRTNPSLWNEDIGT